jgi:hypothetical protein
MRTLGTTLPEHAAAAGGVVLRFLCASLEPRFLGGLCPWADHHESQHTCAPPLGLGEGVGT